MVGNVSSATNKEIFKEAARDHSAGIQCVHLVMVTVIIVTHDTDASLRSSIMHKMYHNQLGYGFASYVPRGIQRDKNCVHDST